MPPRERQLPAAPGKVDAASRGDGRASGRTVPQICRFRSCPSRQYLTVAAHRIDDRFHDQREIFAMLTVLDDQIRREWWRKWHVYSDHVLDRSGERPRIEPLLVSPDQNLERHIDE